MLFLKEDKSPLDAVIFDVGNVLLDYDPRRFMAELGIASKYWDRLTEIFPESEEWKLLDNDLMSDEEFLSSALRKEPGLRREIKLYHKHWYEHFDAIPKNVAAFYQIKEAGIKTYILSNLQKSCFRYVSAHNIFFDDFDGRIFSFENHVRKPAPEIYDLIISRYKLDPARSVFFDDMEANILAAQKAGMKTVYFPIGGNVLDYLIMED